MSEAKDQGNGDLVPVDPQADKPADLPRRHTFTEIFTAWSGQQTSGPHPDIVSKITPEHITKTLELVDNHDQRLADNAKDDRAKTRDKYVITAVGVAVVVLAFIFSGNADQLTDLLQVLIPLVAVGFGGFGWGKRG